MGLIAMVKDAKYADRYQAHECPVHGAAVDAFTRACTHPDAVVSCTKMELLMQKNAVYMDQMLANYLGTHHRFLLVFIAASIRSL